MTAHNPATGEPTPLPNYASNSDQEKGGKADSDGGRPEPRMSISGASQNSRPDQTHRKLKSRHIQLIGIGGTIGTALYVRIQMKTR
jgi:yeast amino acid transporter